MRGWWVPLAFTLAACSSDGNDPGVAPPAPSDLASTSLDGAVVLTWSDAPFQSDPDNFQHYRVYSSGYDLDRDLCGSELRLEGTTVAPEFLVGALTNGVPRCFHVSAVSVDGLESGRSAPRADTPRPDARNVVVFARQAEPAASGFRFWEDLDGDGGAEEGELGIVRAGADPAVDFAVERDAEGLLFLAPVRAGTGVELYAAGPIEDLTTIDFAADRAYRATPIEAQPGFGYVFEMSGGDGFARYGAVRVTHVGTTLLILDWAFQTDPGNPELIVAGRGRAAGSVGRP
jgi:hypothetical protein